SIQRTWEVQGLGGKLHTEDDFRLLSALILFQDSPPSSDLYKAVGSVPTYTVLNPFFLPLSIWLTDTDITCVLLDMLSLLLSSSSSFPILFQVSPPSSVFHNPLPNVPQYERFGLLGSNATHCGEVPFKDSRVFHPVFEDSSKRSDSCIAIISF